MVIVCKYCVLLLFLVKIPNMNNHQRRSYPWSSVIDGGNKMKHFFRTRRVFWLVLIAIGVSIAISGCNFFQRSSTAWTFGEPVSLWLVNPGGGFLCPDLVLGDSMPPIDLAGAGEAAFPEEGVLPIGEGQPSAGEGMSPPGDADSPKLCGPYDVETEVPEGGDPNKHQAYVESGGAFPDQLAVEVMDSTVNISGPAPWVAVSGPLGADGSFVATGRGTVAGRSDVAVSFTGTLTASGLAGVYEMGLEGRLPGGSIKYTVDGQKGLVSGTVISEGYDAAKGVSTQWVDLDGDGQADVIRTFDADGNFIDEKVLDRGGVVTFAHFDASTGVGWVWVDTDGDGKTDVKRRYDRDGNLIEEQVVTGTVTSTMFDNSTGVTTEQVDTDGDGVPDTERRYDRDGRLIEERSLDTSGTGVVIGESYDAAAGLSTQWVDLDGDGQADVVRRRDPDGNLVDERELEMGGVVTGASFDSSTGVETKYVDTDGDGKPDVARRYDRDGFLMNERSIDGTLIETDFNNSTGVTTEWIDLDGDGRPDVIRTYDRDGWLIEERDISDRDIGEAIGQSVDQTADTTTYWVDVDADAQPDVELQCDAAGAMVAQNDVEIAPIGFVGYVLSLMWIPICGGILIFISIVGIVMLLRIGILAGLGDIWDGIKEWWNRPSKDDVYENLRNHLLSLPVDQVKKIIDQMVATSRTWKGGGGIALGGRTRFISTCQQATRHVKEANKETMVNDFVGALRQLFDGLEAMAVFSFGLEAAFSLLAARNPIPGALGFLKIFAVMNNMKKLIKTIEVIEKIKNVKEKIEKTQELIDKWNEFNEIGGQVPQDFGLGETDSSEVLVGGEGSLIAVGRQFLTAPVVAMRGCSPIGFLFAFMGVLGFFAIILYALLGGFRRAGAPAEPAPVVEEAEPAILVGEEIEVEEIQPTAVPTPLPTPTLSPLDFILMFGNFTEEEKAQIAIAYMLDPNGDWIYSIRDQLIVQQLMQTDITGFLGIRLAMSQNATGAYFNNSLFPCDSEIEGGIVVCTDAAEPMPEGDVFMLVMQLAGEVPLQDPERFYTYAAVFDADGETSNNFRFQPPYNWDYFQGTDRWYTLDWDPNQSSLALSVTDVARNQWSAPSKARAVIHGDVVVFFIPAEEFSVEQPGYRLTAFGHDGSFALEQSSGDVTGADPTEALTIPPSQKVVIEE
jgi:hypothetical protein